MPPPSFLSLAVLLFLYCRVMEGLVGAGFNMPPIKLTNWPGKWPWGWLLRVRGDRTWQSVVWTVEWQDFSPHREEHMLHRWWHPWSVSRRVFHGHKNHQNLDTVGIQIQKGVCLIWLWWSRTLASSWKWYGFGYVLGPFRWCWLVCFFLVFCLDGNRMFGINTS